MLTSDIYQLALEIGLIVDSKNKEDLAELKKQEFPYPDSLVVYAKENRLIKKIAAGIDISSFDIYLAKEILRADLVIVHHPCSRPANQLPEVMCQQTANLSFYGLDGQKTEKIIQSAAKKLKRAINGDNFYRIEQSARYFDIDLLILHTIADNAAVFVLRKILFEKKCQTLADFVAAISQLKEFQTAGQAGQPPFIAQGKKDDLLGKVSFSEFVGGQESSPKIFGLMKKAGIETIIVPHLSEDFFEAAVKAKLKVIFCGHAASDSLGMNYLLDKILEKSPDIEIIPWGGLLRS